MGRGGDAGHLVERHEQRRRPPPRRLGGGEAAGGVGEGFDQCRYQGSDDGLGLGAADDVERAATGEQFVGVEAGPGCRGAALEEPGLGQRG